MKMNSKPEKPNKLQSLVAAAIFGIMLSLVLFFLPPGVKVRTTSFFRRLMKPAQSISIIFSRIVRAAVWEEEGKKHKDFIALKTELAETRLALDNLSSASKNMLDENKILKNRLAMMNGNSKITLVFTQVVERDAFTQYYDNIIINRGLNDGVKEGALVLSESGLVGVVAGEGRNTSKVTLLSSRDFSMPCAILERNVYGQLLGEGVNSEHSLAMIQPVPKIVVNSLDGVLFDKVMEGDQVAVNVSREAGSQVVLVGTVEKMCSSLPGVPLLHIKPYASLNKLKYLFVVLIAK